MNYGLIPASVCETLYRESGKFGGRQLLVAAFFLSFILLCYSMGFLPIPYCTEVYSFCSNL